MNTNPIFPHFSFPEVYNPEQPLPQDKNATPFNRTLLKKIAAEVSVYDHYTYNITEELKDFIASVRNHGSVKVCQYLSYFEELAINLNRINSSLPNNSFFVKELTLTAKNLKIYQKLVLPGGRKDSKGDEEFFIYLIEKNKTGIFSFTLFCANIPAENIKVSEQTLFETILSYSSLSNISSNPKKTFRQLLKYLMYKTPSKSIVTWKDDDHINDNLSEYKRLKVSILIEKLHYLSKEFFQSKIQWDRESHKTISTFIKKGVKTLKRLKEFKTIAEKQIANYEIILSEAQQKLIEKKKSVYQANIKATPVEFSTSASKKTKFCQITKLITEFDISFPFQSKEIDLLYEHKNLNSILLPHPPKEITPENVIKFLKDWKKLKIREMSSITRETILTALRYLPIPNRLEPQDFWKKIPKEDIQLCLEGIHSLIKLSLSAAKHFDLSDHRLFIERYAALSISDALVRRDPDNCLESYRLPFYPLVQFATADNIHLFEPIDHIRLMETLTYFNDIYDLRSSPKVDDKDFIFTSNLSNQDLSFYMQFLTRWKVKWSLFTNKLRHVSSEKKIEHLLKNLHLLPRGIVFLKDIVESIHGVENTNIFQSYKHKTQNQILIEEKNKEKQEELLIDLNNDDAAVRLLSYFISLEPGSLENTQKRQLFFNHLFRPIILMTQLADPRFAVKLITYLNNELRILVSRGKISEVLSVSEIAFETSKFINAAKHLYKTSYRQFKLDIPNYRNWIIKNLLPKAKSPENQVEIYKRISLFHSVIDQEALISFASDQLTSIVIANQKRIAAKSQTSEEKKRIGEVLNLLKSNSEGRNLILNTVFSRIYEKKIFEKWEEKHPQYSSGNLKINVLNGEIIEDNAVKVGFFQEVNELLKSYGFKQEDAALLDINISKTQNMVITRKIYGKVYKLSQISLGDIEIPSFKNGRFYSRETEKGTELFFEDQKGKLIYHIEVDPQDKIQIIRDAENLDNILVTPSKGTITSLLDNFTNVLWWGSEKNGYQLTTGEMVHLNYHWDFNTHSKRLLLRELPGYFLSPDQMNILFDDWKPHLLLENVFGERKALIKDNILCDIVEIEGKFRLRPNNSRDALILYEKALYQCRYNLLSELYEYSHSMAPYREEEETIFKRIFDKKIGGTNPKSVLCRSKLSALWLQNRKFHYAEVKDIEEYPIEPNNNITKVPSQLLNLPKDIDTLNQQWNIAFENLSVFFQKKQLEFPSFLNNLLKSSRLEIHKAKKAILSFANGHHRKMLDRPSHKITLSNLIALFEQGDLSIYKAITLLSNEDNQLLDSQLTELMIYVSRIGQLQNILKLIIEIKDPDAMQKKVISELHRSHLSFSTMSDIPNARTYLVTEYSRQFLLRDFQFKTLQQIDSPSSTITTLPPGTGKTNIILPTFQYLLFYSINFWPPALTRQNAEDMQNHIRGYHQRSVLFAFNRNTSTELKSLSFLYDSLEKMNDEKLQFNANAVDVQAYELKFLEKFDDYLNHKISGKRESINVMQKTLRFFKTKGTGLFDEIKQCLFPKSLLNFPIGLPEYEDPKNIELIKKVIAFFLQENNENFLGLRRDNQSLAIKTNYKRFEKILEELAEHLAPDFGFINKEEKNFFVDYIMGRKGPTESIRKQKLNKLGLLRGIVRLYLPEIFKEKANVNFGFSKIYKDQRQAKPYEGSDNPIEGSEIGNPIEAIVKTMIVFLNNQQGLSTEDLWLLVKHLQIKAGEEATKGFPIIDTGGTTAGKFFQSHFPNFSDLHCVDQKECGQRLNDVKNNAEVILEYVASCIAPKIPKYPAKFSSNPQNLKSLLKKLIGLSATPGEKEIYGPQIVFENDEEASRQFKETLRNKCRDKNTFVELKGESAETRLRNTLENFSNDHHLLVDTGAQFRGMHNKRVAQIILKEMSKKNPLIKGVVYYTKKNQLKVWTNNTLNKSIPYPSCTLPPSALITWCDQRHSIGTNVLLPQKAKGFVTIDSNTTFEELRQSTGRLREFGDGQTIQFLMTKAVKEAFKPGLEPITIDELILQTENNQKEENNDLLYRSLQQQLHNEIRSRLIEFLINDENIAFVLTKDEFKAWKDRVFTQVDRRTYFELFGEDHHMLTRYQSLKNYQSHLLSIARNLSGTTYELKSHIEKALKGYTSIIESCKGRLSDLVLNSFPELHTQIQVQQNTNLNLNINTQTKTTINLKEIQQSIIPHNVKKQSATLWPYHLDLFDTDWPKSVSIIDQSIKYSTEEETYQLGYNLTNSTFNQNNLSIKVPKHTLPVRIGLTLTAMLGSLILTASIVALTIKIAMVSIPIISIATPLISGLIIVASITVITALSALTVLAMIIIWKKTSQILLKKNTIPSTDSSEFFTHRSPSVSKIPLGQQPMPLFDIIDLLETTKQEHHQFNNILEKFKKQNDTNEGNILVTNNFLPQFPVEKRTTPLSEEQNTPYEILVIKDFFAGKNKWTIILGDQQTDAKIWREALSKSKQVKRRAVNYDSGTNNDSVTTRQVCLYDRRLGIIEDSINPFNEREMSNDLAFQAMLSKIKLL